MAENRDLEALVTRLREQAHAMAERALRNIDVAGPLLQLSRVMVDAADTITALKRDLDKARAEGAGPAAHRAKRDHDG